MDYIKKYYDLPFLKTGMLVQYYGSSKKGPTLGRITGADGPYLQIQLEGEAHSDNYHPTYALRYFDDEGTLILETPN